MITSVAMILAVLAAVSTALLVTNSLSFAAATPLVVVAVLSVLAQGLWLITLTRQLRTRSRSIVDHHACLRWICYLLTVVAGTELILVALMYAIEIPTGNTPFFGPLSDVIAVVEGIAIVPLVWALSRKFLISRGGRVLAVTMIALSLIAAIGTALMIVEVLSFAVSTGISVAAYLLQIAWLFVVVSHWRSTRAGTGLVRLSLFICWASVFGVVLLATSLAFGWGTATQGSIMIVGLVPAVAAYASWAVWFTLVALQLAANSGVREKGPSRVAQHN
jgi:hypothetical protein